MIKKHQEMDIEITKIAFPNAGIGQYEGKQVTVKNTLPGQLVRVRICKFKNGVHGRLLEILRRSPLEVAPDCKRSEVCGGCSYQTIKYADELMYKRNIVLELLEQNGITGFTFEGIEPAPSPARYRNKMEYTFGDEQKGGALSLGMRKRNSFYEVVNVSACCLVHDDFGKILQATQDYFRRTGEAFYHRASHEGSLRNLVVRKGYFTDEILVNLVTASTITDDLTGYIRVLLSLTLEGSIAGIVHTTNDALSDAVKVDHMRLLYGRDYFMEKLFGLDFKISPFSFFQTNSQGAERLYATAREFAGDTSEKTVFDLYCGTGTIAQVMSEGAKHVIGIELVPEAVEAAIENTKLNNIQNCEFITGDVLHIVDTLTEKPDIIILDPPREGVHPKAMPKIIHFGAETIVYISCKPTSLVNDLKTLLAHGYQIEKVRCHDMFPRTGHVETVVLLSRKKPDSHINVKVEFGEGERKTPINKIEEKVK